MPSTTMAMPKENYDPRWFIWTIVFLVVTGISLVSYIVLSDNGSVDYGAVTVRPTVHKVATAPAGQLSAKTGN